MCEPSGDSLMIEQLTFQLEGGGSIPTSPLQFHIKSISLLTAILFNQRWHSRLPRMTNWATCTIAYGAYYDDRLWASALWGHPVARAFNNKPILELRRMAIRDNAPKNTASRMISTMVKDINKRMPHIVKVISYQDTDVHKGTIYKASGWYIDRVTKKSEVRWGVLNKDGTGRVRNPIVASGDKIRWAYILTQPHREE